MRNFFYNFDWILISENDCYFLVDRKSNKRIEINQALFSILERTSTDPITKNIVSEIGEDTFEVLRENKIFSYQKPKFHSDIVKIQQTTPFLKRVFVEITNSCNEFCSHCYNVSSNFKHKFISKSDMFEIINQAHELGAYEFQITGGEPMLYKGFGDILDYLWVKGFIITINTNLTLLTEEILEKIVSYNININFSLDYSNPKKHDEFRGLQGAFIKTINNFKQLKTNHVNTRVNVMLDNKSDSEIVDLIDYIKYDLESRYVTDYMIPIGRGEGSESQFFNSRSQKIYAFTNAIKSDSCASCQLDKRTLEEYEYSNITFPDCGIGKSFLFINTNGSYALCPSLAYTDELDINMNIYDSSMKSAWETLVQKFRSSLKCKHEHSCDYSAICNGGCRSRAYHSLGSINDIDPLVCGVYQSKYYIEGIDKDVSTK
ncbi:radical SAM/SPASM domain-containing protein [Culicoidibacter larvae]|uniref:radical SAM/SPASM domain-containing protein n=1 Tax=Culicoidibacter larvae TaxID=2579976 RepID=UPI00148531AA|nr:radical SAM protein [Culicoidibacter larvae]